MHISKAVRMKPYFQPLRGSSRGCSQPEEDSDGLLPVRCLAPADMVWSGKHGRLSISVSAPADGLNKIDIACVARDW